MATEHDPGKVTTFIEPMASKNTQKNYRTGIKVFLYWKYDIPLTEKRDLDQLAQQYFHSLTHEQVLTQFQDDLLKYIQSIKGRPPKTVKSYLTGIRQFMSHYDIDPPRKFWKALRRIQGKGRGARTRDRIPSNKELKNIVMHLPIQGKALVLLMASSGLRLGEALNLDIHDIHIGDYGEIRNFIDVRGDFTKTGVSRDAFFSNEAEEYLHEWLKNRDRYLHQAGGRSVNFERENNDNRLFPFSRSTVYTMWHNAVTKTGNGERDRETNRMILHPHVLRKYFRTKLGSVNIDKTEQLMGHSGYLTGAYRKYPRQELYQFYRDNQYILEVFGLDSKEELDSIKEQLKEDRDNLQRIVNGLSADNISMKNVIQKLEEENLKLKVKFEQIEHLVKTRLSIN